MRALTHPATIALAMAVVMVASTGAPDSTAAASVLAKWQARVEVANRSQGTATLYNFVAGNGSLSIRLTSLRPSTDYWVAIYRGRCSSLGSRVLLLRAVTSTTSGGVARSLALTEATTSRLRTLLRTGNLSVAIGSVRRCGTLSRVSLSPTPTPTPSATPGATPTATPQPTPTPAPSPMASPTPGATPTATPQPTPTPAPSPMASPTPYI